MTLASILLVSALSASFWVGHVACGWMIPSQSESPSQASTTAKQDQSPAGATGTEAPEQSAPKTPAGAPPATSSRKKTSKRSKHKKKVSADCGETTRQDAPKGTSSNSVADAAGKKSDSTSSSSCPPTKVIVRQGSTTEPSIQVMGGAEGSQASDERNTANQMLETTESNLKKIEGTQLDSNQQEMIKQVRQFMDQSKAAGTSGDLDQARTLAWKAQLLSEELLKTQK